MTQISAGQVNEQNSFFSAYVSLILIVITFILAFFFRPDAFVKNIEGDDGLSLLAEKIAIEQPFIEKTLKINPEAWSGIIFALKNHDLDAEIKVMADSDDEALRAGVSIFRTLLGEGIPGRSLKVYGSTGQQSNAVLVKLYDAKE